MAEALLGAAEVARRVEALADALAPEIDDQTVVVCLLTGGVWFAADLTRALARRGRHVLFDCLWLASYGDAQESTGRVVERAGLQRPVAGRRVVVVDEVVDSGLSLLAARRICERAGAAQVLTAVFAPQALARTARGRARPRRLGGPPPASSSATAWTTPAACAACRA